VIRLALCGASVIVLSSCGQALAQPGPGKKDMVAVVVAARDIAAGEVVKLEDVSRREVPRSIVTTSIVHPDSASHIINQRLTLPVLQGDPLNWSFFETLRDQETYQACQKLTAEPGGAAEQVARARRRLLSR